MKFVKAERKAVKLKLALAGVPGAGKTMGALFLASGIVGKGGRIAVIDTENERAKLYSDHALTKGISFDVLGLDAPYTVSKYLAALNVAIEEKYDIVIIDSISHEWDGAGGILDQKNIVDARGGNSFTNWGKFTAEHNKFLAAIISANIHTICTMRNKIDVAMQSNDKGKQVPVKVGMKAVQRDGVEYEFDTIFDIDVGHTFSVNKDRTGLFDGRIETLSEKTGKEFKEWLASAQPEEPRPMVKNKLDLVKAVAEIYSNDDKLSAVELWGELSQDEKDAVRPILDAPVKTWLRDAVTNAPIQ